MVLASGNGFFENLAANADLGQLHRDLVPGICNSSLHETNQTAAARYFHIYNVDEFDIVGFDDIGELFTVETGIIQFWTTNEGYFSFHKTAVEIGKGKGSAVRCHQK